MLFVVVLSGRNCFAVCIRGAVNTRCVVLCCCSNVCYACSSSGWCYLLVLPVGVMSAEFQEAAKAPEMSPFMVFSKKVLGVLSICN